MAKDDFSAYLFWLRIAVYGVAVAFWFVFSVGIAYGLLWSISELGGLHWASLTNALLTAILAWQILAFFVLKPEGRGFDALR